jgi:hypothetical protein
MQQDGSEAQGADLEAAREKLFGYFQTGTRPRWREPGNDKGRAQMDADVLRLTSMTAADLYEDGEAVATLLEIADYQGWT